MPGGLRDFGELRRALFAEYPAFAQPGLITFNWAPPSLPTTLRGEAAVTYPIKDFYLTNSIARASPTLQRCSAEILHGQTFLEAAE